MDAVRGGARRPRAPQRGDVERFVHGMTVGTNALLEGRVARTALLATEGFTDLEELGRQARPELYRLCAGHPPPLVPAELRVPVPERDRARRRAARARRGRAARARSTASTSRRPRSASCGAFAIPSTSGASAELLEEALAEVHVSTSHETAGVFREYERCATTIVDAALSPLLRGYLERLTERAREAGPARARGDALERRHGERGHRRAARLVDRAVGPGRGRGGRGRWHATRRLRCAAGRAAAAAVGLDMGGTSCDVSLIVGGAAAVGSGREVGGRALALPMVDVHTVGAGGGSIAWRDAGGALRVGPRSAGADPGPACYGRGGEQPTVTDANLLLGHLDEDSPLAGGVRLDRAPRRSARWASWPSELGLGLEETAAGIVRVASAAMAQAVRVVTVERGIDPRELALVPFGGAGPLHAAQIADELGMRRVLVPVASGVLSAFGLVVAERRRDLVESVLLAGDELTAEAIAAVVERLAERGREELREAADAEAARDVRPALRGPGLRAAGRPGTRRRTRRSCGARSTAPTRSATATRTRTPGSSS